MINWNRRTYTKEQFIASWNSSRSIAECLRKLNLTIYGSSYSTAKSTAQDLGLSLDHMTGQASNRGPNRKGGTKARPIEEVLVEGRKTNSTGLRIRLIREGILPEKCHSCGLTEWMGEPAPLELDHINGVNDDNRLGNLRLLCPNCHALTPTYCSRNIGKVTKDYPNKKKNRCLDCSVIVKSSSTRCRDCANKNKKGKTYTKNGVYTGTTTRKTKNKVCSCGNPMGMVSTECIKCYKARQSSEVPTVSELLQVVIDNGGILLRVGRYYNVSDNAVRKWLRKYDLPVVSKDLRKAVQDGTLEDMIKPTTRRNNA